MDGGGKTSDLTLADVKSLDAGAWKRTGFVRTTAPSLAEVFESVSGSIGVN